MSSHIVEVPDLITVLLKRIDNYTQNNQYGRDNIPHLCIKVKHSNGYAWFGLHVLSSNPDAEWTPAATNLLDTRIRDGLSKICDVVSMETDMVRLLDSIHDVVVGRKRPTIYGSEVNDFMQLHLAQNVQLDVYRSGCNPDTLSYGGFESEVRIFDKWYNFFIYHRGVILYNYISELDIKEMVKEGLHAAFPEIFGFEDDIEVETDIKVVTRTRNKRRD